MENEVKNGRYKDKDGTKEWWLEGKRHREGGPAYEWSDGHIEWFKKGKYHREDGPAVEYANGDREWWINGVEYTEELFHKYQLNEKLQQTLEEKPSVKKVKI